MKIQKKVSETMIKNKKLISTLVLVMFLFTSIMPSAAFADSTTPSAITMSGSSGATLFSTGSDSTTPSAGSTTSSATLNIWKNSTKVYDMGYVDHSKTISLYANSMIVQNENDYTVTLKMRFPSSIVYFGILDPEQDGTADWRYTAGTKNWLNNYDYTSSKVAANVRAGATDENNGYWLDYTIKTDEDTGYSTVTFNVTDISKDIFVMFATVGVAKRITMQPISCIDIYEQSSVQLDLNDAKNAEQVDYLISNSDLKGYFSGRSASWKVEDSVATATIPFDASILTDYTDVTFKDETGTEIDISDENIRLKYDLTDYEDLAFGKTITFTGTNSAGKSVTAVASVVPYWENIQDVTLEEANTGTKIETDSSILPETAKLATEEVVDDQETETDPYSVIMSALGTNMKNMYMYNWKILHDNKTETNRTYQNVKLMFKIPEDWDPNNTQLFYYDINEGFSPNVEGSIETDTEGNSYFVIYTQKLCYYALYELSSLQSADKEMADGTYEVPVSVYHLTKEGQLSMADQCLSDTAKVVVKDGTKTLYLGFSPVSIYDEYSYMTKMWLYGSDYTMNGSTPSGSLSQVIFTSYYKNDNGSYLTDVFNEGTLNYYPVTGYVQLVSDDAQWPARFKVPIMDAIGGGNFEQDAWVTIYWGRAEKISDETPDVPIKEALAEEIAIAEAADAASYTNASYTAMDEVYKAAKAVYDYSSATIAEMTEAYSALGTAIDALENVKADLAAVLQKAGNISNEADIYTEDSFDALQEAIVKAQAVYDKEDATATEIANAITELNAAIDALVENLKAGQYKVAVKLHQATDDTTSMGNASLNQEAVLTVNEDKTATLQLVFHDMSFSGFTGYLGYLKLIDEATIKTNQYGLPKEYSFLNNLTVTKWFEDVSDGYNTPGGVLDQQNPEKFAELYADLEAYNKEMGNTAGVYYPQFYEMALDVSDTSKLDDEMWVEVYAPVMGELTDARQVARLLVDWGTLKENEYVEEHIEVEDVAHDAASGTVSAALSGNVLHTEETDGVVPEGNTVTVDVTANVDEATEIKTTEVVIPAETAEALSGMTVIINTNVGTVELDTALMEVIAKQAATIGKTVTISIEKAENPDAEKYEAAFDLNLKLENASDNISFAGGKVKVTVPCDNADVKYAYYIDDNGKRKEKVDVTVTDKKASWTVDHFSTWVLSAEALELESSSSNRPAGSTTEKNYSVPVYLYKSNDDVASMGDVAFEKNRKALAVANSDDTYDIYVGTNPVLVSGYRSAIIEIKGHDYDIDVVSKNSVTTTDKYDGEEHNVTYIEQFVIKDVEYGEEFIDIDFDVPYTPMEALGIDLTARLYFDWANAKSTDAKKLSVSSSIAKGETETLSEAVDITDKTTGIRLTADEDVLPENTKMTVETITSGTYYDAAVSALDGIAEDFKLYNIVVKASGEEVEPSTTVSLSFPIPADYDGTKVAVYRINEDGTKVVVKGELEKGNYIIDTKTFGVYALALTDEVLNQEKYAKDIQKVVEQYTDLSGHWAVESLASMVNRGLLAGVADNQMAPDTTLNRAMMVTLLHRMAGGADPGYGGYFSDVSDFSWYMKSVSWASLNGIAQGVGDGKFAPEQAITREQIAVMLVNYAKLMNIELPQALGLGFSDADSVSDWADEAVRIMVSAKIIGGYPDGTLRPTATATRAEAAAMLDKFLTLYVDPFVEESEDAE